MFIGKVTGQVVTTQKEPGMASGKLLVVEAYSGGPVGGGGPADAAALQPTGRVLVAVDSLGAGVGEFVLVTQGSSARLTELTKKMPVDAVVIGIIDTIRLHDRVLRAASLDGASDASVSAAARGAISMDGAGAASRKRGGGERPRKTE